MSDEQILTVPDSLVPDVLEVLKAGLETTDPYNRSVDLLEEWIAEQEKAIRARKRARDKEWLASHGMDAEFIAKEEMRAAKRENEKLAAEIAELKRLREVGQQVVGVAVEDAMKVSDDPEVWEARFVPNPPINGERPE